MLTALLAVAGTLLGSIVTHWFQRSAADRAARHAVLERLRQDRLLAYSAFATTAMDYRRHQVDRWHSIRRDPSSEAAIRAVVYEKRASMRTELLRIRLLTEDARLHELGVAAIEAIRAIRAENEADAHEEAMTRASEAIDAFVGRAALSVQALPAPGRARAIGPGAADAMSD